MGLGLLYGNLNATIWMCLGKNAYMPRRIEVDDELHDLAAKLCPKYLSVTGFLNLILDQHLRDHCAVPMLPTCRAGAAGTPQAYQAVQSVQAVQTSTPQKPSQPEEAVQSSRGKSSEPLSLTPQLEKFDDLVREFFRLKKGSKSKTAWSHLMTGLTKIQDKYGDDVVHEQLMAAINGRWAGITLKNYEEFGKAKPKPAWQQQEEIKHPASRVFTAERGFDDEPVTNPLLKDVF